MSQQITFDWQFDEEAYDRQLVQAGVHAEPDILGDGERKLAHIALRAMAALLFVVLASGSAPESLEQKDRVRTASVLDVVLEMEEMSWQAQDREQYTALIDPSVDEEWVGAWRDNWGARSEPGNQMNLTLGPTQRLSDEMVQADVYVALPRSGWWQSPLHRETRFYREADGVWLRTLPPASYWGEPRTLETERFTFYYFARDEPSVQAAARRLDAAYAELFQTLGLNSRGAQRRIEVLVQPGIVHSWDWTYNGLNVHRLGQSRSGVLEITSPILSEVPQELSDSEYLTERIFSRITTAIVRDRRYVRMRYDWSFVGIVLRGWLVEELLGHPSVWREESATIFRTYSPAVYPLQLSDVDEFEAGRDNGRETVLWRFEAAISLLDYIVAQYGPDALPDLMRGFAEYSEWPPLIEGVFGVSAEEFTDGWNEYLAAEYGLP